MSAHEAPAPGRSGRPRRLRERRPCPPAVRPSSPEPDRVVRSRALDDGREELDAPGDWGQKAVDDEEIDVAWDVRRGLAYRWYDCLLIAAAHQAGRSVPFTEGMAPGVRSGGLTLVNSYTTAPDAPSSES